MYSMEQLDLQRTHLARNVNIPDKLSLSSIENNKAGRTKNFHKLIVYSTETLISPLHIWMIHPCAKYENKGQDVIRAEMALI